MKILSKFLFLFTLISLPQVRAEGCADCATVKALQTIFSQLKYMDSQDREKGANALPQVMSSVHSFADKDDRVNKATDFKTLLHLIAVALPYDVETSLAGSVSSLITDPALLAVYRSTVVEVSEPCQRQLLVTSVEEHSCTGEVRDAGLYERPGVRDFSSACVQADFDFETCLSKPARVKTN